MTATAGLVATRKEASRRLNRVPAMIWVFLLGPLVVEIYWVFYPAVNSFWLSLTKWDGAGAAQYIGLRNYRDLASDSVFITAITNNAIWIVLFGTLSVACGLLLAVTLNRPRRGIGIYRSMIYLPMVFSSRSRDCFGGSCTRRMGR